MENSVFYNQMLVSHSQVVSDMVNSALDQSNYFKDALNLIDSYEKSARNDRKHVSEATDFIGLCQKARTEIKRIALEQKVNHDD